MVSHRIWARRDFLRVGATLSSYALGLAPIAALAQASATVPERSTLQSGDFIWPKKPGEFVPYNAGAPSDIEIERKRWDDERKNFIQQVRSNLNSTAPERQLATNLEAMDFREFLSLYQADEPLGVPRAFSGGAEILYVGHVGVVAVENNAISVIEALWGKGVVRTPYDQWLKDRQGSWVWHGRVAQQPPDTRSTIAAAAAKYLGKPYNFWNFDLSDSNGFYCSKLCWLSVRDSLSIAIDNKPNSKRDFWFSPKQLLKCQAVQKIFVPGSYTF
jgi:cell wall-associated NlpC family hydrolase